MIEDSTFRLIKADYTAPRKASANEDFSTAYTYDAVGNPLTVRRYGVVDIDAMGRETFGLLDNLSYTYSGGNQVASIEQDSEGIDFYGRTGYSLTSGEYRWATSGNLTGDSSRGMIFYYNFQGQPTRINFTKTSQQQLNTFSASGQLLYSNTIVMKQARPISSTTRHYSADRIFENGKLLYSYFPGGYFDAEGVPHFTHTDYQGSIIAVTDSAGHVVQHTAYYPYGEPHREPSGQPYLHGGKERLALSADYDYGPRRYHSSALLWHKPDSKAGDYTHISPYVFCAANPILFTDPTGNDVKVPTELGEQTVTEIFNNLSMLVDDILIYYISDGYYNFYSLALETGEPRKRPTGTDLVQEAIESPNEVIIATEDHYKITTEKDSQYKDANWTHPNGKKSVIINFSSTMKSTTRVLKEDGNPYYEDPERPAFIGIGHELIHAIRYFLGKTATGQSDEEFSAEKADNEELETIGLRGNFKYTENKLRKEHGLYPRASFNYK